MARLRIASAPNRQQLCDTAEGECLITVLTDQQSQALLLLLDTLEEFGITYQITGGLAGNFHGSRWPLHDIDLDVPRADISRLAAVLGPASLEPPRRVVDQEFDFLQLEANIYGVVIDVGQVEHARIRSGNCWEPLATDLSRREGHYWRGRPVWVQPLADLIAYKRRLGRIADVRDLERLLLYRGSVLA